MCRGNEENSCTQVVIREAIVQCLSTMSDKGISSQFYTNTVHFKREQRFSRAKRARSTPKTQLFLFTLQRKPCQTSKTCLALHCTCKHSLVELIQILYFGWGQGSRTECAPHLCWALCRSARPGHSSPRTRRPGSRRARAASSASPSAARPSPSWSSSRPPSRCACTHEIRFGGFLWTSPIWNEISRVLCASFCYVWSNAILLSSSLTV